jgi:hypothetical protein
MTLLYNPYQDADAELMQQVKECIVDLGYDVEIEEEEVEEQKVTVH